MEWMKQLLGSIEGLEEEKITEIVEAFNKEFPKNAVPKEQYSKKTNEISTLTAQLEETTGKIEELSKGKGLSDELQGKLDSVTKELEDFKADTAKRETNQNKLTALKKGLGTKFATDALDLLAKTFDLDEITLDKSGNVVDLDSMMDEIAEARPSLVIKKQPNSKEPNPGGAGGETQDASLRKAMGLD